MASDVLVALITGAAALAVSLVSFPLNYLINHLARRAQALDLMGHYRDPLLWSVHDLRSRVRTILDEDFLGRYLTTQRAVGELMIAADHSTPGHGRCIGFASFCHRLDNDPDFAAWFEQKVMPVSHMSPAATPAPLSLPGDQRPGP